MKRNRFEALVHRLEPFAKREPQTYKLAVGALAMLGYAYILLILLVTPLLLIGLGAGFVWVAANSGPAATFTLFKVGVPLGLALLGLIGTIISAFQVHIPPPEGSPLARGEAPRLFAMLDDICTRMRAPCFHHVLLTDDFNASVAQVPRLGMLGWQTNYLVLGLPFLQAMTPDQFRAVIAHEVGHLSRSHSRFSGQMYRLRQVWLQLLDRLEREQRRGGWIFQMFFRWYAPFFHAFTFVLARADEYVADRCAAEIVGAQTAAEALVAGEIQGRYLSDEFWPGVLKGTQRQPEPPAAPFSAMFQSLQHTHTPEEAEQWLEEALGERTGLGDTHPSLTDRLASLGFRASAGGPLDLPKPPLPIPPPPVETAAARYLGPAADRCAQRFDQIWRQGIAPRWRQQYAEAREAERRLHELQEQAGRTRTSEADAWELAELTARFDGPEAAIPLLQKILSGQPNHAKANYILGRLLLDTGRGAGLHYLDKGIAGEPERAVDGCEAASWFLRRQGRQVDAARYRNRAQEARVQWARAREERESFGPNDRFQPHGLPPEDVQRLQGQLLAHPTVEGAYLVRKVLRNYPERPLYVLGLQLSARRTSPMETHDLLYRLSKNLFMPGETTLLPFHRDRLIARLIRQVPGAQVYRKS